MLEGDVMITKIFDIMTETVDAFFKLLVSSLKTIIVGIPTLIMICFVMMIIMMMKGVM